MSVLLSFSPLITSIVFLAGLVYFARQGGPAGAKAVIDIKNEQIKAYEDREKEHRQEMLNMRDRLTKIETTLKSKDEELQRLTSIFQNRDPQSAQITEAASKYMASSLPVLLAIAKKLDITIT